MLFLFYDIYISYIHTPCWDFKVLTIDDLTVVGSLHRIPRYQSEQARMRKLFLVCQDLLDELCKAPVLQDVIMRAICKVTYAIVNQSTRGHNHIIERNGGSSHEKCICSHFHTMDLSF